MDLRELEELKFDEVGHIYLLNGVQIPSVTTIMRPLSNSVYGSIPANVLNAAAERGTAVHNAIENWLKFKIKDIPEELSGYFDSYMEWESQYKPENITSEYRMYHKLLRYAGTSDLICEIGGKTVLVDYKTSASTNKKMYAVQLEAYAQALRTHGLIVDEKRILHLRKDGKFEEIIYPGVDLKPWAVFGALNTVYNYQEEMKS